LLCLFRPFRGTAVPLRGAGQVLARNVGRIFFFHLVCLGWILFRAESLSHVGTLLAGLTVWPGGEWSSLLDAIGPLRLAACAVGGLLVAELIERAQGDALFVLRWPAPVRGFVYAVGVVAFLAIGEYRGPEFIYFQF
jgi:hypothetical protein